jgi:hypothetical protein
MRQAVPVISGALVLLALVFSGVRFVAKHREHESNEFRSDEGRYTITMPPHKGNTLHQTQNFGGMDMTSDAVNCGGDVYMVMYGDYPPGTAAPRDLATNVKLSAQNSGARTCRVDGGTGGAGPDDWRDFEIEVGGKVGTMSGRIMLVRNRLYVVGVASDRMGRHDSEVTKFVNSFALTSGELPWKSFNSSRPADSRPAVILPSPTGGSSPPAGGSSPPVTRPATTPREEICGASDDPKFRDVAPAGGYLVGLDVGYDTFAGYDVIGGVTPIYMVGDQYSLGKQHGPSTLKRWVRSIAKPGYAIGALHVQSGGGVDGFHIIYMKIGKEGLETYDTYKSEWYGGPGGNGMTKLNGEGTPVIGIIGKENARGVTGIGLAYRATGKP